MPFLYQQLLSARIIPSREIQNLSIGIVEKWSLAFFSSRVSMPSVGKFLVFPAIHLCAMSRDNLPRPNLYGNIPFKHGYFMSLGNIAGKTTKFTSLIPWPLHYILSCKTDKLGTPFRFAGPCRLDRRTTPTWVYRIWTLVFYQLCPGKGEKNLWTSQQSDEPSHEELTFRITNNGT